MDDRGTRITETTRDADLITRSRTGEQRAYAALWEKYHDLAQAIARPLAHADAEDIVSDAFTMIWTQLQQGAGPQTNFRAYLLATVRNIAFKSHRKLGRVVTGIDLDLGVVDDGPQIIENAEANRDILLAFEHLPERWQRVLWMIEVEQRPRAEVSAALSLSPNSTTQLLRRAKEGLREAWLAERFTADGVARTHRGFVRDMPRYVRGGWATRRRQELREHIGDCGTCRAREIELKRESALLGPALALLPLIGGGALFAGQRGDSAQAVPSGLLARFEARSSETLFTLGNQMAMLSLPAAVSTVAVAVAAGTVLLVPLMVPGVGETPTARPADIIPSFGAPTLPPDTAWPEPSANPVIVSGDSAPVDPSPSAPTSSNEWFPSPDDPGETSAPAPLTLAFDMDPRGDLAPEASGVAEPGATIEVRASGTTATTIAGDDGRWHLDLSALGLGVGTHSVSARRIDAVPAQVAGPLTFTLALARLTAEENPTMTSGSAFVVTGIPNSVVCVVPQGTAPQEIRLGPAGTAPTQIDASTPTRFRYCAGTRLGPEGNVALAGR